ncbi:MAG: PX domain-containing protein ypt35 [Watsoniomyces obsoletus]|nr:MAG: PX domain-containing protein ypt35 [Watsoniomyces obsoletus]
MANKMPSIKVIIPNPNESPAVDIPGPGFTVIHQKLELEVDLLRRSLRGKTEITIQPTHAQLRHVRLHCRQSTPSRIHVNGKAPMIQYNNPFDKIRVPENTTVHQWLQLRQKIGAVLKDPTEDLIVTLPRSLPVDENSPPTGLPKITLGRKRSLDDAGLETTTTSNTAAPKSAEEPHTSQFSPIIIEIHFATKSFRDGLQFVGCEEGDPRYPHVYTRNSPMTGSMSAIFPCVDDISARCTWEIAIKCPRTLGDAFARRQSNTLRSSGSSSTESSIDWDQTSRRFTWEDEMRQLTVVCSGELTDEVVDVKDESKKVVSFLCANPVSAQHVGFSVGPYEYVDLAAFREADEDERLGQNAVPVHGYCLPGREGELMATCIPMAKAIDYFTLTYGSYPFSSYVLCFVDDLPTDIVKIASGAFCSTRLLLPLDIQDGIDEVTRQLVDALASQWVGINITPSTPADVWIVVGLSYYITDMFMRKLCGHNEHRFRQKVRSDRVCELDVGRPSLSALGALINLDPSELEFMILKAPLVLSILDRRMTKSGGTSGLSRIISRIILMAKVGDLAEGCISNSVFQKTCERLGHLQLNHFFQQWVYGAGCPRFTVTQKFNKKKLCVEMLIRQTQAEHKQPRDLDPKTFIRDIREGQRDVKPAPVRSVFTGPMTIRIHEADGTPYEHIVEIREASTKFEIPYNTKYKRLKRNRRHQERARAASGRDAMGEEQDGVLLYCLGDVLQSDEEMKEWQLSELSKDEEQQMSQESYEWIRMDSDSEWICTVNLSMPWYMFLSQLQQDRDVAAQYESVQYLSNHYESKQSSTHLVRVLMDTRYFHGVRTAAAHGLARCAKEELEWIGMFHLQKAFEEMFCKRGATTKPGCNDFSDRRQYFVQCAIVEAMAKIRDNNGRVPSRIQQSLLSYLQFNDNSKNEFSDAHYVCTLMKALAESLVVEKDGKSYRPHFDDEDDEKEERKIIIEVVDEIDRHRRSDQWKPSFQNVRTQAGLECKRRLLQARVVELGEGVMLRATRPGNYDVLRLKAFETLIEIGKLQDDVVVDYLLHTMSHDTSPYVRDGLRRLMMRELGAIAMGIAKKKKSSGAEEEADGGLVIETEESTQDRHSDLARRQTVAGALTALKEELGGYEPLKDALWDAVKSKDIGMFELRDLLDVCELLYDPQMSLLVKLKLPRYWRAFHLGQAKMQFTRTGTFRLKPAEKFDWSTVGKSTKATKRSVSPVATRKTQPAATTKRQKKEPTVVVVTSPEKPTTKKRKPTPSVRAESVVPEPSKQQPPPLKSKKRKAVKAEAAAAAVEDEEEEDRPAPTPTVKRRKPTPSTKVVIPAPPPAAVPPRPKLTLKLKTGLGLGLGGVGGGGGKGSEGGKKKG